MNIHRKLKINWWLWMILSLPSIVYSWLRPRDVKGWMISDWGYLIHYLQQTGYTVTHDIWNFFAETLFWSAVPALLLGWIAQYLIMLAWEAWRARRRAHTFTAAQTHDI
jgi:hypothetical protein